MRGRRRVGDRSTLDRITVVGANCRIAQDGPFGSYGEIVGYSGSQDHSSYLGPGRVLSSRERRRSELPRGIVLSQGIFFILLMQ